jgi:hypothetical protein
MANNRQQQAFDKKQRGWDTEAFKKEERESRSGGGSREPYDPTKETIVGEEGRVPLHAKSNLLVEYVSYNGGPKQICLRKIGIDREGREFQTRNIGKLWGDQAAALATLLASAAEKLKIEKDQKRAG